MQFFRYTFDDRNDLLDSGTFGRVYKAQDLLMKDVVALKVINWEELSGVSSPPPQFREKLIHNLFVEAKAHARLGSQTNHIVKTTNIGYEDGIHFVASEFVSGGNIRKMAGKVPLSEAKGIVRQIIAGLSVAHASGVLHCDIKPENILYDKGKDFYKISDFGLLQLLNSEVVSAGGASLLKGGTLYYQPPEVQRGEENPSVWSDLYALALVLHDLVCGFFLKFKDGRLNVPGVCRARGIELSPEYGVFLRNVLSGRVKDSSDFISHLDRIPA